MYSGAFQLILVLALSLFIGIEREEHKVHAGYAFGGVRTFPMIGLAGYALASLSGGNPFATALGFLAVGALLVVSYWHKLKARENAGATTEVSALLTYLVGALVQSGSYWLAVALGVVAVLLLELREGLQRLSTRIAREEIVAFAKFLLLAAVILPVLPDRPLTPFLINPFRTWLVVVAVSGVSYASYALQKWLKERGGVLMTGLLGGAYSSTVTTIVLARSAKEAGEPRLYAGSALAASGMMYLRVLVLVLLVDVPLAGRLAPWFCGLGAAGIVVGIVVALARRENRERREAPLRGRNPLEMRPALVFGAVFVAVIVVTRLVIEHTGATGLYALSGLMGLGDVDPFVLGLAQSGSVTASTSVLAVAAVLATSANNLANGVYALLFADRRTGLLTLELDLGFAAVGLLPLAWLGG